MSTRYIYIYSIYIHIYIYLHNNLINRDHFVKDSTSYVKKKTQCCKEVGIDSLQFALPGDTTQEKLAILIDSLSADDGVDGILVQLVPCFYFVLFLFLVILLLFFHLFFILSFLLAFSAFLFSFYRLHSQPPPALSYRRLQSQSIASHRHLSLTISTLSLTLTANHHLQSLRSIAFHKHSIAYTDTHRLLTLTAYIACSHSRFLRKSTKT